MYVFPEPNIQKSQRSFNKCHTGTWPSHRLAATTPYLDPWMHEYSTAGLQKHMNQTHGITDVCTGYKCDTFHPSTQGIPTGHTTAPTTFHLGENKAQACPITSLPSLLETGLPYLPQPAWVGPHLLPEPAASSAQGRPPDAPTHCQPHPLLYLPPQHLT